MSRSSIAVAVATLVALSCLVAAPARADEPTANAPASDRTGHEEPLGQAMPDKILSQDQSQGVDAAGNPQAYWVTAGNAQTTAMFQVTDIRSGQVVFAERLPEGVNSWANTFSDALGTVFFATTEGFFYSWKSGDEHVTQIPFPYAGEGIWRLASSPDGVIYGGTYPGGQLFSYDPATAVFENHGQIIPGETYGRALAVDEDYVYFGTQPHARLARFDRETGEVLQIELPAEYANEMVVYDMTLAGGYLLLRVWKVNDLIVYNTATGQIDNIVKAISDRAISPVDPTGPYVYYRRVSQGIVQYNLETQVETPLGWKPNAIPGTWAWIDMADPAFPGLSLSMTYYNGRVYVYNLQTKKSKYISEAGLQGAPTPLQSLGSDSSGTIYAGGFLTPPGIASFDPGTGTFTLLTGGGQVEGFGRFDDALVYGRYPGASLYYYDPAMPWSMGANPAAPAVIGDEQDRPQALVQVGDRVAVGSVPISGRLGGALSLWDPATGSLDVTRNVVENQSIVSLAERDGLLVGGTSVNGGYGIDAVATQAELFVFDPVGGERLSSIVPVPGAHSINGLEFDENGTLWGIADGTLFAAALDEASGTVEVVRSEQLFALDRSMYGQDREIVFVDGMIYATSGGALWKVNPITWTTQSLAGDGVMYLTQGSGDDLYFARGFELFRWAFDEAEQSPECTTTIDQDRAGPLTVTSGVTCIEGASISGPVTVRTGASLVVDRGEIRGPVAASGAGRVWIFGSTIKGPVSISGSSGTVRLDSTTVSGPVSLRNNAGSAVVVTDNTVSGPLACSGNVSAPSNSGAANSVAGPRAGQCAAL